MQLLERTDAGLRSWLAVLAAAFAVCLAFGLLGFASNAAYAAPDDSESTKAEATADADAAATEAETTGEQAADQPVVALSESTVLPIGDDLFYFAQQADVTGDKVKANYFVAGDTVNVQKATVNSDAFIAGNGVVMGDSAIKNNLFLAGNNITLSGTTAKNVFAAGNNLDIAVDTDSANIAGRTVFLKGTFEGDVSISGQSVVIDPYIVVKGTLNVSAATEPTIASTAKIGSYNFNLVEYNDTGSITDGFAAIGSEQWVKNLIMLLVGMLILMIAILLFTRTETIDSTGRLVKDRPVAILVTGLLSIILVPVLLTLLLISIVGWRVAVVLAFVFIAMGIISVTYTAIALGRAAFSRINKWISSIIFVAIFGLLCSLPVVDFIIGILCTVFAIGSLVQGWWVWRRGKQLVGAPNPDGSDPSDFNLPRGSHYAPANPYVTNSGMPASRPLTPSGVGQSQSPSVTGGFAPDEPEPRF